MKYKAIVHSSNQEKLCNTLDEAEVFIKQIDPEYVLINDDPDSRNKYRCRYLSGGYREGMEAFIVEVK